jgi:hypothetical protein
MDAAMERRINVATNWASTRIAYLDKAERYEDSYAITQEFREWITCIGENVSLLDDTILVTPSQLKKIWRHQRPPVKRPSSRNLKLLFIFGSAGNTNSL